MKKEKVFAVVITLFSMLAMLQTVSAKSMKSNLSESSSNKVFITNLETDQDLSDLIENVKNMDKIIWKAGDYRYIFRPDGKCIDLQGLDTSYLKFYHGADEFFDDLPNFITYQMKINTKWTRKGTEITVEGIPYSVLKLKADEIAFDRLPPAMRNKVKAAIPKYEAAAVAAEKKEWNPRSVYDRGKILECTPNKLVIDWGVKTITYVRDNVLMKKLNNNFTNLTLIYTKYIETVKEEYEEFCKTNTFSSRDKRKGPYLGNKYFHYDASIVGKKPGESDEEYICRNIKWPKSSIDKGIAEIEVRVELFVDVNGSASAKIESRQKIDEDLKTEIIRVIESAKWNPAIVGKTKVNTNYRYNYKLSAF